MDYVQIYWKGTQALLLDLQFKEMHTDIHFRSIYVSHNSQLFSYITIQFSMKLWLLEQKGLLMSSFLFKKNIKNCLALCLPIVTTINVMHICYK